MLLRSHLSFVMMPPVVAYLPQPPLQFGHLP